MESATILTPPSTSLSGFLLPQNPNIPGISGSSLFAKGTEYEKYQHYINVRGEVLPTPHRNNDN